jgi:Protein of unknown function (DUF1838)
MDTPCSSPFLSRRDLLVSTGSAAIVAPLLLGIGTASAATGAGAAAASRIDFTDPAQNLRAFMRLTADLDPNKESTGWFGGHIFAVVDGKPLQMLCGVEGFGVMRVAPQKDGTYRVFNRELAFYKDPKTDEFVDQWTNPLTGETCEVSPIHNRTVTATVAPVVRQDFDGHMVERPFNPSWTFLDGQVFQVFELHAAFPNPMKVAEWPRESSGPTSRISEIFQRTCRIADLDNPALTSVPSTGTWTRVGPWLPWMLMGQAPGHILYRTFIKKLGTSAKLPTALLERTKARFPEFLRAPGDDAWGQPNDSSFTVYMQERKPAPPRAPQP